MGDHRRQMVGLDVCGQFTEDSDYAQAGRLRGSWSSLRKLVVFAESNLAVIMKTPDMLRTPYSWLMSIS